jgi:hypothetical protein
VPDFRVSLAPRTVAVSCLIVFLMLSTANIALVRWLDNTNLETSNGLWKMPDIRSWEKTGHGSLDSGGFLYFPTYGNAARVLPDSWFTYGTPPASVTHRKMATLNAVFGALASTVVFLLACRSTDRLILPAAVAGLHATAGFVLLNSLNSEDVIPAYTLFVCMTACIWLFLKTGMVPWLAAATFFLGLVAFFHWTLFPPAAAGLAVALFLASSTLLESLWLPILALAATAAWIQFWAWVVHLTASDATQVGLLDVLFPSKAALTGWLGFSANKFVYSLAGMGNYWVGARNVIDYVAFFRVALNILELALSLAALVVAILVCLWTLLSVKSTRSRRAFASFGLTVFFSGELMHLYSQPQDPQSQIQPMFILFIALLLALEHLTRASQAHRVRVVGLTLLAIALLVGMHHVSRFAIWRSQDSVQIQALRDFMVQFPRAQTRIVSHGFEGWNTWLYVFGFEADRESFTQESIMLASAFTLNYGISAAAAADLMTARIAGALDAGYRVYAGTLWTQDEETFVGWMSTVAQRERASEFYRLLLPRFQASNARETLYGTFVELKRQ